ncbi:DinB family protein [Marininema halotolerans]|uniref:Uncharacterized damage-inducible protein DinB (Forms a four-helix bundle) n=1 Tax=Marininema halotolerans TaxID=1155944 RepID=A0A1I6PXM1_9BACL|nr:DinB family protein [Marininema halotolerans]SFS44977.1 Uncharacterized damage-inducible protein DinB (forms a four-helix bundle) [Marininema halotolerans]
MDAKEYFWVKETRKVLLEFCTQIEPADFTRTNESFGSESVRDLLLHIAECYHAWMGSYVLLKTTQPITPKENRMGIGMKEIVTRFAEADAYVEQVLERGPIEMETPIVRPIPWRNESESISISPQQLLMHTVTHEFHHKGQIVLIARQMGYTPLNTDVLGIED